MAQTFKFKWPVLVRRNDTGELCSQGLLSEMADSGGLSIRSALWIEHQDEWEFHLSNGCVVNVPGRNVSCVLTEPDLPDLSEVPDE